MRVLCDAIAFCYGPATVLQRVLRCWRDSSMEVTLVGTGTTLECLARTDLVDDVIEVNTEEPAELSARVRGRWDIFLSVCNPTGFAVLSKLARRSVYWDFLLWMRIAGPAPEEFQADAYVVEAFPGTEEALLRFEASIPGLLRCSVLADWRVEPAVSKPGFLLLNLGGQRSRLTEPGVTTCYPSLVVEAVQRAADSLGFPGEILVTADARTSDELARSHSRHGWSFRSLGHDEFLDAVDRAERVITHPGIYSPFESIGRAKPTLFLPSSNYTQILQLAAFRKIGLAGESVDWPDFFGEGVPAGLPEPEGVRRVLELVERGRRSETVCSAISETCVRWLAMDAAALARVVEVQRRAAKPYFGDYRSTLTQVRNLLSPVVQRLG